VTGLFSSVGGLGGGDFNAAFKQQTGIDLDAASAQGQAVVIGAHSSGNDGSTAVGYGAHADPGGTALGWQSSAIFDFGTAIGFLSQASADPSTAVGSFTVASGNNSSAFGSGAFATGTNSTAIGQGSVASGANASAFGQGAVASGSGSTALGAGSQALHNNSVALGAGAVTTRDNQVVIGGPGTTVAFPSIVGNRASQSGPTYFVTSDGNGNLATSSFTTDDILRQDRKLRDGVALALAAGGAPGLLPGRKFAVSMNYGAFDGTGAMAMAATGLLYDGKQYAVLANGSVGLGFDTNVVGARGGISVQW
jgi:autotransporter adhesin